MKNVMMAAVSRAFKFTRERVGEILAAADLRRGRDLMVYIRRRKFDELRRHARH